MLKYHKTTFAIIALAIHFTTAIHASTQNDKVTAPSFINGDSNENSRAALYYLAEAAGKNNLIIIGRLGKGERSRRLNHLRLQTVKEYLTTARGIPKDNIIVAKGEPVNQLGRVEVYLEGKLYMVFTLSRNRNFAAGGDYPIR